MAVGHGQVEMLEQLWILGSLTHPCLFWARPVLSEDLSLLILFLSPLTCAVSMECDQIICFIKWLRCQWLFFNDSYS